MMVPPKIKAFLTEGVQKNLNMLIVGTDEDAKMELFSFLISQIDEQERIALVSEKTALQIDKPYVAHLYVDKNRSASDLVKAAMRMDPHRILCDHVKENAFDLLQSMSAGFDGSMGVTESLEVFASHAHSRIKDFSISSIYAHIEDAVEVIIRLEQDEITLESPVYNRETEEMEMIVLFETKNGKEIVHSVPWKKQITKKYERYDAWQKQLEEYNNRSPKTNFIKEINYQVFFDLFTEKYPLQKMDKLNPLLKESVSVVRELKEDTDISLGHSKFGGDPDLPIGTAYPFYNEEVAYSFIMQMNCEEFSKVDREGRLPKTGMLYFFHLFENESISLPYDYKDREGFDTHLKATKIFYHAGDATTIKRTSKPHNEHIEEIKPANISFVRSLTIKKPFENEVYYKEHGFEVEWDEADELAMHDLHSVLTRLVFEEPAEALNGELESFYDRPFHQLFGEAEHYQGPPLEVIQHQIGNQFGLIEESNQNWTLLFQLWEDEEIGLNMAGDAIVHYFIKEEDLKNGKFDAIYSSFECG